MLQSMTGFFFELAETPLGPLLITISSLNKKHLDIQLNTPKEFLCFESKIRNMCLQAFSRGQISLRMEWVSSERITQLQPKQLQQFKQSLEKLAQDIGFVKNDIPFSLLLEQFRLIQHENFFLDLGLFAWLEPILKRVFQGLCHAKTQEGVALHNHLQNCFSHLLQGLQEIKIISSHVIKEMQKKLHSKIKQITQDIELEQKLLRETVSLIDKLDITEEIVRLDAHFHQIHHLLHNGHPNIGRKLDFFLQEVLREVHTIGSKSSSADLTKQIIEMKIEIEKMKEQAQNVQ